jgi:DNA-directed RNA polymerase I subunit RPA1
MGHVELCVPVYNPTLFALLFRLLRLKCYACHALRVTALRSRILVVRLMLLDCGRLGESMALDETLVRAAAGAVAPPASERDADTEAKLTAQNKVLDDYEVECTLACGKDAGCGLGSDGGPGRYSFSVRGARSAAVDEFLRSAPAKTCGNCGALALPIKKDGFSKLFQTPLTPAAALSMAAKGVRYTSATATLRTRARIAANRARRKDEAVAEEEEAVVQLER